MLKSLSLVEVGLNDPAHVLSGGTSVVPPPCRLPGGGGDGWISPGSPSVSLSWQLREGVEPLRALYVGRDGRSSSSQCPEETVILFRDEL